MPNTSLKPIPADGEDQKNYSIVNMHVSFIFKCISLSMFCLREFYVYHVYRCLWRAEGLGPLELELEAGVSCPIWMLGVEPSVSPVSILKFNRISLLI